MSSENYVSVQESCLSFSDSNRVLSFRLPKLTSSFDIFEYKDSENSEFI